MNKNVLKNLPLLFFLFIIFGPGIIRALGSFAPFLILSAVLIFLIYKNIDKLNILNPKSEKKEEVIDLDKLNFMKHTKKSVFLAVIAVFGIWLFFASVQVIEAGETGVYSLFGKVREAELSSGIHLVIPLAKVTRMSVRTEEYTMSIAQGEGRKYGADAITSLTKEGLSVDLDMTVLYRLNEEKASDVYREVGLGYEEKIIRPMIRTSIRDIIANYEAKDIYSSKREEASLKIQDSLKLVIEPRGIVVEKVLLRNVALPDDLAQSIQSKLQAEQEAEKYDFVLAREIKEKERKIIEAEGQREAQKIINESLTTNYLYYLYVNGLKEREGTIYVPTGPNTGVPMVRNLGN